MNIRGVKYATRNTMHIMLGVYLDYGDGGPIRYVGYNELERLNIDGISFVNTLYGSVGAVKILPLIVYRDKPIHKYLISGSIGGTEVPYSKEIFDYVKAELIPFAERHKYSTDLYLYSDLFFLPKKEYIQDFTPVGEFLEESGYIQIEKKDDPLAEAQNSSNNLASLYESCKVDVPRVQTVEELVREQQTGERVNIPYIPTGQNNNYNQGGNSQAVQQSTDHTNFKYKNPQVVQFGAPNDTPQDDTIISVIDKLEKFIKETWADFMTSLQATNKVGISQQMIEIRQVNCAWVFISYLQLIVHKCTDALNHRYQIIQCREIWDRLIDVAWSLGLINGMYKSINSSPVNLDQLEESLKSLYSECKRALTTRDQNSNVLLEHIDVLESQSGYNKDTGINSIIYSMNNKCTIAFKYITRVVRGVGLIAAGDYDCLCMLYLIAQKYLSTSYRNTMDLQQRFANIKYNIEKDEIHTAWIELCGILSKLQL